MSEASGARATGGTYCECIIGQDRLAANDLRPRRGRGERGSVGAAHLDGTARVRSVDQHVGEDGFVTIRPQDPDDRGSDARGWNPHRSGHYHANSAWLLCSVLAHNLGCWTNLLPGHPLVTNRTRRTRLVSLATALVNLSGQVVLRLPARRPWAEHFLPSLVIVGALPAPSG